MWEEELKWDEEWKQNRNRNENYTKLLQEYRDIYRVYWELV